MTIGFVHNSPMRRNLRLVSKLCVLTGFHCWLGRHEMANFSCFYVMYATHMLAALDGIVNCLTMLCCKEIDNS